LNLFWRMMASLPWQFHVRVRVDGTTGQTPSAEDLEGVLDELVAAAGPTVLQPWGRPRVRQYQDRDAVFPDRMYLGQARTLVAARTLNAALLYLVAAPGFWTLDAASFKAFDHQAVAARLAALSGGVVSETVVENTPFE
jgi:hypothetical protein